jgi:hypothetical protein
MSRAPSRHHANSVRLEPLPATRGSIVTNRPRLPAAAHAMLALAAAAIAVMLAAGQAAASDELGDAVLDAIPTVEEGVEPAVETLEPIVEAVVEPPIAEVAPVLDPVGRIPPAAVDPLLPGLEPLDPVLPAPTLPVVALRAQGPAEAHTPTRPIRADAIQSTAQAPPVITSLPAENPPPVVTLDPEGATPLGQPTGPIDSVVPLSGAPAGAGTTLIGVLLIGLALATSSGWATFAFAARLRPTGLTLAPPVPPG